MADATGGEPMGKQTEKAVAQATKGEASIAEASGTVLHEGI